MGTEAVESFLSKAALMLDQDKEIYIWKDLHGVEDSWAVSNNPEDHADVPAFMYANADAAAVGLSRNYSVI